MMEANSNAHASSLTVSKPVSSDRPVVRYDQYGTKLIRIVGMSKNVWLLIAHSKGQSVSKP